MVNMGTQAEHISGMLKIENAGNRIAMERQQSVFKEKEKKQIKSVFCLYYTYKVTANHGTEITEPFLSKQKRVLVPTSTSQSASCAMVNYTVLISTPI